MFEIYYVDGRPYEVSPNMLQEFLRKFPNAKKNLVTDPVISSFEQQENEDLSGWQGFKNSVSNLFENIGDLGEVYFSKYFFIYRVR